MSAVLVLGATSAIAEATARRFAADHDRLFLAGRRAERLVAIAADLGVRGAAAVDFAVLDVDDVERHATVLDAAEAAVGPLDVVLVAHGTLPDQAACEREPARALEALRTNALATIAFVGLVAQRFERRGSGTIAVVSSVAGDRGRASNYVYGAAKAAVDAFLEGLRQRLHPAGVRVVTIKPGFVDTPMTAAFDKGVLWAQPDRVARAIHRAVARGAGVVYVPWFWRPIMLAIRLLPRPLFRRIAL